MEDENIFECLYSGLCWNFGLWWFYAIFIAFLSLQMTGVQLLVSSNRELRELQRLKSIQLMNISGHKTIPMIFLNIKILCLSVIESVMLAFINGHAVQMFTQVSWRNFNNPIFALLFNWRWWVRFLANTDLRR